MNAVLPMSRGRLVPQAVVQAMPPPAGPPPRVTVVIPNFNYGRFLVAAAESALSQEGVDVEVIVIDDGSTDGSARLVTELAERDTRVRPVLHQVNAGHVASVNEGLEMATGEFVCRLDADDLLTPGSLGRSAALMRRFDSVGLVYGHPVHFFGDPPAVSTGPARSWSVWSGPEWVLDRCRKGYNCITTPEVLLRADVVRQVGGIDTRMAIAEDMQWWLRIAASSDVGRVNGPDQALHREHEASMTATVDKLADLRVRVLAFRYFVENAPSVFPDVAQADVAWRTALADQALDEACRAYDRGRTGLVDVEGYLDVAQEILPEHYTTRPLWRAYQARAAVGPRLAPFMPFAAAAIARRRVQHVRRYRQWQRNGL